MDGREALLLSAPGPDLTPAASVIPTEVGIAIWNITPLVIPTEVGIAIWKHLANGGPDFRRDDGRPLARVTWG